MKTNIGLSLIFLSFVAQMFVAAIVVTEHMITVDGTLFCLGLIGLGMVKDGINELEDARIDFQ